MTTEAERILADASAELGDWLGEYGQAAQALFGELKTMDGLARLVVSPLATRSLRVQLSDAVDVLIVEHILEHSRDSYLRTVWTGQRGSEQRVEGIAYDPIAKSLTGTAYSDEIVPTPGELRPRRTALAVLVEHICERFRAFTVEE